jgi:hypothetical protein
VSEETFNNAPITPPKTISPSAALGVAVPLESAYLQSLASPSSTAANSLAAKPTSSLPHLRKEDELRYWAGLLSGPIKEEDKEHHKSVTAFVNCAEHLQPASYTGVGRPKFMSREYSDLLVVGIVVLFLAAVLVLEAMEKFGDLWVLAGPSRKKKANEYYRRGAICGRRQQRGQIYLEDDETIAYVVKKPFILGSAPKPKYKISVREKEYADEDPEEEEFHYDSDAYMKV